MLDLANRGGTAVLVKNCLDELLLDVDTSVVDLVWLKLRIVPNVLFGFVYIPPNGSTYYSHESFAVITEKLKSDVNISVLIMSDMNT